MAGINKPASAVLWIWSRLLVDLHHVLLVVRPVLLALHFLGCQSRRSSPAQAPDPAPPYLVSAGCHMQTKSRESSAAAAAAFQQALNKIEPGFQQQQIGRSPAAATAAFQQALSRI